MGAAADKVSEVVVKTAETGETIADTQKALADVKSKVGFFSGVGEQLKEFAKDFKTMDTSEKFRRLGGLVAMATLGWILKPDDAERMKAGERESDDKSMKETPKEKEYSEKRKSARKKAKKRSNQPTEMDAESDPKADEEISEKQSAVNMKAIRYFKEDGTPDEKPNSLAGICRKEKAIPSTFILKSSYELFKKGVGSFEDFKKTTDKLVDTSITDPQERVRQATVILSCCAVGRFQIVPHFHFQRMNWSTRGEEGLRAMYNFIRSTDLQIDLFKNILSEQWNRYHDVGLLAVSYYAGDGVASAYKANPSDPKFQNKQYGGHSSIHEYAQRARNSFAGFKAKCPGLSDLDYAAMAIESNETGGGIIFKRAMEGKAISQTDTQS